MKTTVRTGAMTLAALLWISSAYPQAKPLASSQDIQKIYDHLLPQIDRIPIYDNHSHATFPDDSDMDAQAAPPDETSVLRLRDTNPEFVAAAKSLFAYPYDDFQPEHAKWLIDKKKAAEKSGTTAYWDSILDKLNIETCLEVIVGIGEEGFRGGDEFRVGVAQTEDGSFVGRRGLRVHIGIVRESSVGVVVVNGNAIDLREEMVVDFLDVLRGSERFGLGVGGGDPE